MIYKYLDISGAYKTIKNETLLFRSPDAFNDPFDSSIDPAAVIWADEFKEAIRCRVLSILNKGPDWKTFCRTSTIQRRNWQEACRAYHTATTTAKKTMVVEWIINRCLEHENQFELDQATDYGVRSLRVFCASRVNDSILMWSHYGQQHKGIVLGFDESELCDALGYYRSDVIYAEDMPYMIDLDTMLSHRIEGVPIKFVDGSDKRVFYKCVDWKYENEVRMCFWRFDDHDSDALIKFPLNAIKEVIFGYKYVNIQNTELSNLIASKCPAAAKLRASKSRAAFRLEMRPWQDRLI